MAQFQTLDVVTDPRGVSVLTLNRPEKHNAMSGVMLEELTEVAEILGVDPAVRVVILTGAGKSFCAGGDLAWMQDQMRMNSDMRRKEARKLATSLGALDALPKPLIGKLQGNAFGGGVGLACVCDIAYGAAPIKLGLTETRLGLIPATIGPYVVARMGVGAARQVFMSGRLFDGSEAVRLGLLARVVAADDLDGAVEAEVAAYLACAPGAVAAAKELARALGPRVDAATIDMSIDALAARWDTQEAADGIAAFFDKRPASWAK